MDNKGYLETTKDIYRLAAETPDVGLCCTTNPMWLLPGLDVPVIMQEMNYGCGTTVSPSDLSNSPRVLYIGVGGGMELLQFAYYSRYKGAIIGVDVVDEMLDASKKNFVKAEKLNPWFKSDFVDLKKGDALDLPIDDNSVDVVAQNCVFNIFKEEDLKKALSEAYRVLKPNGRLVMSDPVSEDFIPSDLREDARLRALCLSGAMPLMDYIKTITDIGFGTIEIRAKRAYRVLSPNQYDIDEPIVLDSVEICAIKDPMPDDGPCIFAGNTAIYHGNKSYFDDKNGHVLPQNQPIAICMKTTKQIAKLKNKDIYLSPPTYHYDGGGCC